MDVDQAGEAMVIIVRGDGTTTPMRVRHDSLAAPMGDIVFIAYCREDVNYLLRALARRDNLEATRIQDITDRLNGSTPGRWKAFLERDGGLGGDSIISFDAETDEDMYLYAYGEPASDSDYEFVAAAHEMLPHLLQSARAGIEKPS